MAGRIILKILWSFLTMTILLQGCKRGGHEVVEEMDIETLPTCDALFDSLIWLQYHCPDDEEKTVYEWNWAYDVREAMGVEDLDSLITLSREMDDSYQYLSDSCIPFEMNTATNVYAGTARFCMLNVYQMLAELVYDTPLGEDAYYYNDYVLWEELFKEFDAWYVNGGSGRGSEINCYYRQLAEFRTDNLLDELNFFLEDNPQQQQAAKALPPHWDPQWIKTHPAIRHWYEHRMKMADKIRRTNPAWAGCIRTLTYRQVALYTKFEKETEDYYRIDED